MSVRSSWFQRFLLPGLAFKAVVIGGGYATGRELAEFFLPSGLWGGLLGMVLATAIWSLVCTVTFLLARAMQALDYRSFFKGLLGPGWICFEVAFVLAIIVMLAVFGAAAGEIFGALFGWPLLVGALALMIGIAAVATFGNAAVERLFKWVSFVLYGVYALFLVLSLSAFGDRVFGHFAAAGAPGPAWPLGGLTYAGYNIIGAVVILPVTRHLTRRRDAVVAGLVAGPLAMAPALLFFVCMGAFSPQIAGQALPSDYLLARLNAPAFHTLFQVMIFLALLESGTGAVHAFNERIAAVFRARAGGADLSRTARLAVAAALLVGSIFLAQRFGLVALIARGYRFLAYAFLAVYVVPLMTFGTWKLLRLWRAARPPVAAPEAV